MAERVVPIIIRVTGGREGAAEVGRIRSAFDQLDRADLSHARQALASLGGPENVRHLQEQARAAREVSATVRQADQATLTSAQQTAARRESLERDVLADIARIEAERRQIVTENSRAVENLARHEADQRIREGRRAADALDRQLEESIRRRAGRFDRIKGGAEAAGNVGQGLAGAGAGLTAAVTAPIVALATLGVKFNAVKEQALTSFTVMLKSGEKAKQLFADLNKFAADTPFELPELNDAAKSLLSFGITSEKIIPTLTQIGDIASGLNIPLGELADIYGKARVQGRLFGEDINQLTGRGIPIISELAKQFKVSESEVKKLVEAGKVGFPELEKAFASLTAQGGQFGGLMAKQSATLTGRLSSLSDAVNQTLGKLTEPLFAVISQNLPAVISVVEKVGNAFANLSPTVQRIILVVAGIAAAIGPVLVIVGGVIAAIAGFVGALASAAAAVGGFAILLPIVAGVLIGIPALLAQIAIVATPVIVAVYGIYQAFQANFGGIRDFAAQVLDTLKSIFQSGLAAITGLWQTQGAGLLATVRGMLAQIVAVVGPAFAAIVQFARENFTLIVEAARTIFPLLKTFISQQLQQLAVVVRVALAVIKTFWAVWGDEILAIVKAAFGVLKAIVQGAIQIVAGVIKIALGLLTGDWRAAWEGFKQVVAGVWQALKGIVKGGVEILFQLVKGAAQTLLGLGAELGRNLINGLTQGIDDKIGTVREKVNQVVNLVASLPVIGWQQKSPSRLFMGYGRNLIEGLILGIAQNGPKLSATIQKEIVNRAKAVKDDLGKAAVELAATLNESRETRTQRAQLEDANELKAKVEEISKLRRELGRPVASPLPSGIHSINFELDELRDRKAIIEDAKDRLKQFDDVLNGLPQDATNLQKVNAFLADPFVAATLDEQTQALLRRKAALVDTKDKADELKAAYDALIASGNSKLTDLQKQLALIGVEGGAQRRAVEIDLEGNTPGLTSAQQAAITAQRRQELALLAQLDAQSFLNDKLRQYNSALNETVNLTERQKLELELQKPQLAALTQAERERLRVMADQIDARKQFEELTKQLSDSFNRILTAGVKDGFKGLLKAALTEVKNFGLKLLDDIIGNISRRLAQSIAGGLLGGGAGRNSSAGGGFFGSLLGSVGKFFGLGAGATATPGFNPSAAPSTTTGAARLFGPGTLSQLFGGRANSPTSFTAQAATQAAQKAALTGALKDAGANGVNAASGAAGALSGFSLKGLGTSLAAAAPLLGFSLGTLAGGQSGLGQILGGAGGLLGGLVLAASTGAIGGSLGGLFALSGALGPAALVAAPLLIAGAILLGRAKQRRADEGQRDQLTGEIAQVINQAESTIKRASQVSEITGTLTQLDQRFQEYLQSVQAIKTRSVRESALRNQVPVHQGRIATLHALGERRKAGLALDSKLVAEFATGGTYQRLSHGFQGVVPGAFDGKDDQLIAISRGERIIVLTPQQDREATPHIAPYLRAARVPGFAEGGSNLPAPRATSGAGKIEVNVTNNFDLDSGLLLETVVEIIDSERGQRTIRRNVQKDITDGLIDPNRRRR